MIAMILLEGSGPDAGLSWLLYLFLGFFLLMVIVGWLVSRRKGEQVHVKQEMPVQVREDAQTHPEEQVIVDDLTKLEGIGPKVSKVLHEAGITTFSALANAKAEEIQNALNTAGLQMMNPEGWIEQAALAAKGDWTELEKLQGELKGGRRK